MYQKRCDYCGHEFSSTSNLKAHQRRAKYCMKLQTNQINATVTYDCKYCNKKFNLKHRLIYHENVCKKKDTEKDLYIKELETELKVYKELHSKANNCIEEIAKRPTETFIDMEIDDDYINEYQLSPLKLNHDYIIEYRDEDGYINVTNLCKSGGKQFKHWKSLDKTKAFLQVLSSEVGIPTSELIKLGTGSKHENSQTWVHPQVAINIAQWISPQFDVKVSAWVYEVMMTGKVDISNTKSFRELQKENKDKQLRIRYLEKKYLKRHSRVEYKERNIIYILTTQLLKQERRYILGKAINLTSRLSTYNKTDEHEVIYYQECGEKMDVIETMVFSKLDKYREQANRERFILPEGENIEIFIDKIKECINFINST